jgi:RHS repeat-associated protein
MLMTEAGKLAWMAQLDVHGAVRKEHAGIKESDATDNPWRYPGQYEDAETGLYYNRFRYYDRETAQYISKDPIKLAGGLRTYGYVKDPTSWLDPLGLAGACGTPGDKLEKEVEDALKEAGISILERNKKIFNELGQEVGEIDFVVQNAIIEVTVSPKGKLPQIQDYMTELFNPTQRPVVLYAPSYRNTPAKDIEKAGALVVRDLSDLIALVK